MMPGTTIHVPPSIHDELHGDMTILVDDIKAHMSRGANADWKKIREAATYLAQMVDVLAEVVRVDAEAQKLRSDARQLSDSFKYAALAEKHAPVVADFTASGKPIRAV